jgi:hypothetical protein
MAILITILTTVCSIIDVVGGEDQVFRMGEGVFVEFFSFPTDPVVGIGVVDIASGSVVVGGAVEVVLASAVVVTGRCQCRFQR